jgi:Virulence factor BrkB
MAYSSQGHEAAPIQDKCPQLGAALAYFTVFSLAPLLLVLLAVFGLIFGGSDHARQKITGTNIGSLDCRSEMYFRQVCCFTDTWHELRSRRLWESGLPDWHSNKEGWKCRCLNEVSHPRPRLTLHERTILLC